MIAFFLCLSFALFSSFLSPNIISIIVNIMKVNIERNNLQLEVIRYRSKVDFIHIYVCEATDSMQYRSPKGFQEVSSANHFGSVSDD